VALYRQWLVRLALRAGASSGGLLVTVKALLARILAVVLCCVAAATVNPVSAEAASAIQITKVYYNSPGSDYGSNTSLNAEWVRITNTGTTWRTLTGWTLRDAAGHVVPHLQDRTRGTGLRTHRQGHQHHVSQVLGP
jgi:hypothetical protein